MMHRVLRTLLLSFMLAICLLSARAQDLHQQRQAYRLAQLALKTGQTELYSQLKAQLKDYPLYPYLVYEELKRRLSTASHAEIESFLGTYATTPLSYQMRGLWLYKLYQENRWQKFLEVYDGRGVTEFMCYALRARIRAGQLDGVIAETKRLWLIGTSQHSACDRLFEWFTTHPEFTPGILWARIELAMAAGNPELAGYLAEKLNDRDRAWVSLWRQVYANPRIVLTDPALESDKLITRQIVMYGVLRLADFDVEQGKAAWEEIRSEYSFDQEARDHVDRSIALLAAYRHHPHALDWLNALPPSACNDDVYTWRARAAMRNSDWQTLKSSIKALKDTSDEPLMWKYWLARALEETGETERARELYSGLARERDYYGFLAADRLGLTYSMQNHPLVEDPAAAGKLIDIRGVRRAYELLRVGQETDARREWALALNGMTLKQKKLAAVLAGKWGWYADAIRTVALTGELDDLKLRFPTPYEAEVAAAAHNRKLDPALIYGIMRRESAFAAKAVSPSGALGLMQLLPGTAALTAHKFGLSAPTGNEIFDPKRNIELGSAYLSDMLRRFSGNQALATAAYNAGPERVETWLPEKGALPTDAWVENIPYYETRDYVKAVLAYAAVYESKLGEDPMPLAKRMEPIPPTSARYAHK
jgi:soluble lytic murein transglycosylase